MAVHVRKDAIKPEEDAKRIGLGFLLVRETTGYAGGGAPQKSFSFKHRAKRVANKQSSKLVQFRIEA